MKRVLTFLAIMLLPLSVMAMTPVSDQTLSDVTGQAGVNINADLTMNISIGTMAWGDEDGIRGFEADGLLYSPWGTIPNGGYVGVTGFNITNLRIKAREADTYNGWSSYTGLKPITIDVATAEKAGVADTTFVRFGLGSLQITMDAMSFNVALGTDPAAGLDQLMGVVSIGDMAIYISPYSYVDIYAHAGCGVNLEFNIIVDEFQLDYVSWGDTDGLPGGNPGVAGGVGYWIGATNTAGYVGLDNLRIGGPILLAGTVAIDVVYDDTGVYGGGAGMAPFKDHGPTTIVHISFPTNFNINVTGPIEADVKLDSAFALDSANAGTLGDIYISAFGLDIAAGSWVDIWAH